MRDIIGCLNLPLEMEFAAVPILIRLAAIGALFASTTWGADAAGANAEGAANAPAASVAKQASKAADQKKLKLAKNETAVYVNNMHCKTCARKISSKLFALKGVKEIRSDVKANLAIVVSEPKKPLDPLKAWAAVQSAGFKPTKLIGPAGTYVPHEDKEKKEPVKLAEKPKEKKENAAPTR